MADEEDTQTTTNVCEQDARVELLASGELLTDCLTCP